MADGDRIILVEDDETLRMGLEDKLAIEGYQAFSAATGEEGLELIAADSPALVILDVGLPGMSGLEVLSRLRERGAEYPIILLTARAEEGDKVMGLELGADDYVTKPFGVRELIARVRAHLRRRHREHAPESLSDEPEQLTAALTIGPLEIDFHGFVLRLDGDERSLSNLEWKILELLVRERGKTVSRDRFLREIWGYEHLPVTRTVDFHVSRLRQKIESEPKSPRFLTTVHGIGYRFEAEE